MVTNRVQLLIVHQFEKCSYLVLIVNMKTERVLTHFAHTSALISSWPILTFSEVFTFTSNLGKTAEKKSFLNTAALLQTHLTKKTLRLTVTHRISPP